MPAGHEQVIQLMWHIGIYLGETEKHETQISKSCLAALLLGSHVRTIHGFILDEFRFVILEAS